jgi:asparagine synthase (glutamine-hydrolysing)
MSLCRRGIYTIGNCTLAHERLSIVDLEHGRQPLFNEDKSIILVCNGEIYNHQELRCKLKSKKKFRTNSDSEIILHLYEDYGISEFLNLLDGMFAFVLMGGEHEFLAARDPIGIK